LPPHSPLFPYTTLFRSYADHYHGHVAQGEGRLFGGLVLAQAFIAAARTDVNCDVHSMHGYFLRPGKPDDVIYGVERLRDGRTFRSEEHTSELQSRENLV